MSSILFRRFLTAVAIAGLAPLFFWRLLLEPALGVGDWESFYHFYDWIRISLTRYGTLPLYLEDAWWSSNFLANPQSPLLGPFVWLLLFLPTSAYVQSLIVGYAAAALLGMVALLRDEGATVEVALFAAVVFTFNGFFFSRFTIGHHCFLGLYLLPALLWAFRRAVLGSRVALWLAAALNVIVLFEGSHHPFLWQNAFLLALTVLTCLHERSVRPGWIWLLLFLASLGLGAVKLLPMFSEFGAYDPTRRPPAFPPATALWSLVSRGQNVRTERTPLTDGENWWEYACYVGWPALAALLTGLVLGWRRWPMILTGGVFLILSLDLGPWLGDADPGRLASRLPLWRSQRAPSRFLVVAVFACAVAGSLGLQALLDRARRTPRVHRALRVAMAALTLGVALDLYRESRPWQEFGAAGVPASTSHVPTITTQAAGGAEGGAEIVEFSPNRFVVEVRSRRGGRILLPREPAAAFDQWTVTGGTVGFTGGNVSVWAPPGTVRLTFRFTPRHLWLGLSLTVVTLGAAAITLWRRAVAPARHDHGLFP